MWIIRTLIEIIYAFGVLFIGCELGQRIVLAFDECNDMIDQLEWYLFPMEIQKLLPIVNHFMQQPIEIKFFGSYMLNRDAFKYVSSQTQKCSDPISVTVKIPVTVINSLFSMIIICKF